MADRSWLDDARGVDIVDGTGESERVLSRRAKLRFSGEFTVAENPGDGGVDIGLSAESLADAAEAAVELAGDHAQRHRLGGEDEIDGDRIAISYVPDSYTRTPVSDVAGDERHLTAHLAGLDGKVAAIGQPIWKWNGVDTSQFDESGHVIVSPGEATTSRSLSVVADPAVPGGNVLRAAFSHQNTVSNSVSHQWWWINETFPLNFRMEVEVGFVNGGTGNVWWGFLFYGEQSGDASTAMAYGILGGASHQRFVLDAGTVHFTSGTTGAGSWISDANDYQRIVMEVRGDKVEGLAPRFRNWNTSELTDGTIRVGGNRQNQWSGSLSSGWASVSPTRIGLAFRGNSASLNTLTVDIARWAIYEL